MPEEPNLPDSPTPSDAASEETAAEWTDAEWTDDIPNESPEVPREDAGNPAASSLDEWDTASMAWEDDLDEPSAAAPQPPTTREALAWIQPTWRRLQRVWLRLIRGIRNRVPAAAKLSDTALSALLIASLVILLVLLNSVRQPATARPSTVETPDAAVQDNPTAAVPAVSAPEPPSSQATPTLPPEEPAEDPLMSDRITQIQSQMTDSAILNAQRVIASVQADLVRNHLTLVLNGEWYRLSDYDQTQLAQALLERSQALLFTDLRFQTDTGEVLARSPVVGNQMVILQRERPPVVPPPAKPRYRLMIDR